MTNDTLKWQKGDSLKKSIANKRKTDTAITVYGIGSAEALQFDKLTAAGSVNAQMNLHNNVSASVGFNFGSSNVKNEKADSVPLSLFYFPELANVAFIGGIDLHSRLLGKNNTHHRWSLALEGSLQRRNIQRDSTVYQFGVLNYNIGPKYQWIHSKNDHQAIFTVGISYNYVSINKNNADAFTTLFDDYQAPDPPPVKRYFHGISFMTSLQLDNAILFARAYTDLNQSRDLAFTVGIKAAATFFSF